MWPEAWTSGPAPTKPRCPTATHSPPEARSWGRLPRTGCWGEAPLALGMLQWVPNPSEIQQDQGLAGSHSVPPTLSTSSWPPSPERERGPWRVCLLSVQHRGHSVLGLGLPASAMPRPFPGVLSLGVGFSPGKEVGQGLGPPYHMWHFHTKGPDIVMRGPSVICRRPLCGQLVAAWPLSLLA